MLKEKLKILFCSSEAAPYAKVGGLADVGGALPKTIYKLGHDIKIFLPKYKMVDSLKFNLKQTPHAYTLEAGSKKYSGKLWQGIFPGTKMEVNFIECQKLYNRDEIYGEKGGGYPDNLDRYSFFSRSILHLIKELNFKPDIIHCNDWQTSLIPPYLKSRLDSDSFYKGIKTLLTIHNLGYQGIFPKEEFSKTGLPEQLFNPKKLEFYGKLNMLKGGLIYSNIINAVSPTYSREIQTKEYGFGLEGILIERKRDLFGILNGVDYSDWNPLVDKFIKKQYGVKNIDGKKECKQFLQKLHKLPQKDVMILGMITRLADQKGLDLIKEIIDEILNLNVQFVLLGTGDPKYENFFKKIKRKYPEKAGINLAFNNALAHQIEAGSDAFLMPSHYEPCGLNQIYSLKYGTIPVVRKTGGLADTIIDCNEFPKSGNGFVFKDYSSSRLLNAVKRAYTVYKDKKNWMKIMTNAMLADFSWEKQALKYQELYFKALLKKT